VTGIGQSPPSKDVIAGLVSKAHTGMKGSGDPGNPGALPDDIVALLQLAERQRPELRAAEQRVRGAAQGAAATRGTYGPQVSVFGMGDVSRARRQDTSAGTTYGVAAALPLYDGGQRRADAQAADAERRRTEQDRERIGLQVAQEVQDAVLTLRAAEQNVQTATVALAAARAEYTAAETRYQAGRSIVTEALDALAARVQAEANVVQAAYQYDLARDQLRHAVGEP